jgi:hypothetical protein
MLAFLPGCAGGGTAGGAGGGAGNNAQQADTLNGPIVTLLTDLQQKANDRLTGDDRLPEVFTDPVTAENCQGVMGLTPEQLSELVEEASVQTAMINVNAYSVLLAKCPNAASAASVADTIAQNYDSNRWICVLPDESFVVTSGSHVLLVSASSAQAQALKEAFTELADGLVGEVRVFYTNA